MTFEEIIDKVKKLEYHQKLLLKMAEGTSRKFDYLIVKHSLSEAEVQRIFKYCAKMSIEFQKQKAEGLVYFLPLYNEFKTFLEPKLKIEEVITACLAQGLYLPLMRELEKYNNR